MNARRIGGFSFQYQCLLLYVYHVMQFGMYGCIAVYALAMLSLTSDFLRSPGYKPEFVAHYNESFYRIKQNLVL